jgi:hypothetical protein
MSTANAIRPVGALNLFAQAAGPAAIAPLGANNVTPIAGAAETTAAPVRVRSKVWLNIGPVITVKDADGNDVQEQTSFPVNLAIDTMRKRNYPWDYDNQGRFRKHSKPLTKNQLDMKDVIDASNMLHDIVMSAAGRMEPGTSADLPEFKVTLQRLHDDIDPDAPEEHVEPEANSRMAQLNAMFTQLDATNEAEPTGKKK